MARHQVHDETQTCLGNVPQQKAPHTKVPDLSRSSASANQNAASLADDELIALLSSAEPMEALREQDRLLPAANVARVMAATIPQNAKIARDARAFMQELVSEFICFLTSEVNDICIASRRRVMSAKDFVEAANNLDLNEYAELLKPLVPYFEKAGALNSKRRRRRGSGQEAGPPLATP